MLIKPTARKQKLSLITPSVKKELACLVLWNLLNTETHAIKSSNHHSCGILWARGGGAGPCGVRDIRRWGFAGFTCTAGSTFTPPTHLTSTSSFKNSRSCCSADPSRSNQCRTGPAADYPEVLRDASGEHMCGMSRVWCMWRRPSEEPDHHTHVSSRHFQLIRPMTLAPHPARIRLSVCETHPARQSLLIYALFTSSGLIH